MKYRGNKMICTNCQFENRDSMIDVKILFIGVLKREGDVLLEAHSTVTLVQSGAAKIIVDTGTLEHRGDIVRGLSDLNIDPLGIDMVVNTHLHFDHISNNEIFAAARFFAHKDEMPATGSCSRTMAWN